MKHLYLKCLLLGIIYFARINASAYDCYVDGIYYNLDLTEKTACVTYQAYSSQIPSKNRSAYVGSVTIPSSFSYNELEYSVTSIDNHAFTMCSDLTSITIPNSVTSIGGSAFRGCYSLNSIDIPMNVTCIQENTFRDCSGLMSIAIPEGVKSIGWFAFYGCRSLTTITIPNSVTNIDWYAFQNCINLTTVYSKITDVFDIPINAFDGCEKATLLYVPKGLSDTYKTTTGWNYFKYIEELESENDLDDYSFLLSCNSKGSITINNTTVFTNKIGITDIFEDAENTFVFTPKTNCKLEQVCLNGFDITLSVENNTLKAVIPAKSQMVVTFAKESGDMNNDGIINISDVVLLVNMILGQ